MSNECPYCHQKIRYRQKLVEQKDGSHKLEYQKIECCREANKSRFVLAG